MSEIEAIRESRFQFLHALWKITGGDEFEEVSKWELGRQLGFDRSGTQKITQFLSGENLLRDVATGGLISITHKGVVEVENALSHPEQPTQYFPPVTIVMRDQYTAGQVGTMGPHAKASDITFQQIWQQSQANINLVALAGELATLRKAMRNEAEEPFHDKAVVEIGEAQEAAENQDGPRVFQHLKNAGKWALDVATKIGVNLATEALKKSLDS